MGFVNRMDQNVFKYRLGIRMKKWWWSPFVWMVMLLFRMCVYCIVLTKMNAMSPCLFWLFEGWVSSSHVGIQNIPSDVCYDDTKHDQVKSEHRRIQNPFKHLLRLSVFALAVNGLKSLNDYAKTLHLRCLKEFCTGLCWKTKQV